MLTKKQNFDLGLKGQVRSDLVFVHNNLLCLNTYMYQFINKRGLMGLYRSPSCFHLQNCLKLIPI